MLDKSEAGSGSTSPSTAIESDARGEALHNADYASLTRRAATDDSCALIDEVLRLITASEAGTRMRQRVSRADAFKEAVEGFLGDLLAAKGDGWVYRLTGHDACTKGDISTHHISAVREGLKKLDLLEEVLGSQQWSDGHVTKRATRFRATPALKSLAIRYGVQPDEAEWHFVLPLPEHPLRRMGASTWTWGNKIRGRAMEIDYTAKVTAMQQVIRDLNNFLDSFVIMGGTHRGYYRQFECGDHPQFDWQLGGRLYSQGKHNYQQLPSAERRRMTIDGQAVCEVDVRASTLTIFQAARGQPLDFSSNDLDPYAVGGIHRQIVKEFITTTFGKSRLLTQWPQETVKEYAEAGTVLPHIRQVRDAATAAYPLLGELRRWDTQAPPLWAELQFLESEAVLRAMLGLQAAGIPSLSMWDGLIVPSDHAQLAKDTLTEMYTTTIGADPCVILRHPAQ
jgi:hypothetical protein